MCDTTLRILRFMTPLTVRIRELREAKAWSQRELARRAGIRQATVSQLETGQARRIDLDTLEKIARALGCPAGYLIVEK